MIEKSEDLYEHPPVNYCHIEDCFQSFGVETVEDDCLKISCVHCRGIFIVLEKLWKNQIKGITRPCTYCGELSKP